MAIYKRGKTYWYEFIFDGVRVRASAKTGNRRAAEQIESARKTQLAKREVGLDVEKPTIPSFNDAVDKFLEWSQTEHALKSATTARYRTSSKALIRFFGNRPIDQITKEHVERFKAWRSPQKKKAPVLKLKKNRSAFTNKPLKPATINRELACLKAVLNLYVKIDVINRNPVCGVKFLQENNEIFVVITREEEARYLMAASQPLQDVATLILETGCRPDEVLNLRLADIDLQQGFLRIEKGKTKSARRRIPLSNRATEILRRRIDQSNCEYLFESTRATHTTNRPIVKLNNAHNGAIARAETRRFRLYDLRHTFASRLAMVGVDLVTLAALLGHSRVQMVLRYAHPVEQHKVDAIQKLQEFNLPSKRAG